MRRRWALFSLLLVVVLGFTAAAAVPGQAQGAKRVIKISMVSYKFVPDAVSARFGDSPIISINRGEAVVLQVSNDDPESRNHSIAARWLVNMDVQARGQVRTGTGDERRFFAAQPGEKFELEMTFNQSGSFPFVCGVLDHGARGQTGVFNVTTARR